MIKGKPVTSSAAGAYQITRPTWRDAVAGLAKQGTQIADFSMASQDSVAEQLIRHDRARDAVRGGNLEAAIPLLTKRWTSLPGGSQPAPGLTMEEARRRFDQYVKE